MILLCLLLIPAALAVSLPATALARRLGRRLGALDAPGVPGQVKMAPRCVPNTGGVGIFLGFALPLLSGLLAAQIGVLDRLADRLPELGEHLPGIAEQSSAAFVLLGALALLHVMGLIDDRRALGPMLKLGVMLAVGAGVVLLTGTRLLTLLDGPAGGPWLSILLTVLWLAAVTNAMNFLDNMDGLAGGVAAIAAGFFLAAALVNGQWFVAACLALLVGALLGFLVFNFPPASIFMGDGGSLVVGFLLAFLTTRTTFYSPDLGGGWYGVFMPVVVLAIPLYDFVSVTLIRLSQGKSPFVGDLQHFSHRLVRRGLSRRAAVVVIYGFTAVTAIGGISLASLHGWQAALVGLQTLLVLMVLAIYEWSSTPALSAAPSPPDTAPTRGPTSPPPPPEHR